MTASGEVNDLTCSRLAAAMLDAHARMLVAWTLSRDAGLTPRGSVLCHTQQMSVARMERSASGKETERGEVSDRACTRPAAAMHDARTRMLVA